MLLVLLLLFSLPESEPRTLAATPTDEAVSVDGRLDEAAWQMADVATGFRQFEPDAGRAASSAGLPATASRRCGSR